MSTLCHPELVNYALPRLLTVSEAAIVLRGLVNVANGILANHARENDV